jgi:hypothetical protein
MWLVLAAALTLPAAMLIARAWTALVRRSRERHGQCIWCGQRLPQRQGRCPNCGLGHRLTKGVHPEPLFPVIMLREKRHRFC